MAVERSSGASTLATVSSEDVSEWMRPDYGLGRSIQVAHLAVFWWLLLHLQAFLERAVAL